MPVGIIVNSLSILIGGALGAVLGSKLSTRYVTYLNMLFGLCAMSMGINSIILMENMPAVILSIILGTCAGLVVHLGEHISKAASAMQRCIEKFIKRPSTGISEEDFNASLLTVIILFCSSGTGIYGAMISGMNGDHSILFSKSILDLFTALIFACTLGIVVSVIAFPQFIILMILFLCAGLIYPATTPAMINDFKACGGMIMLATGFRMLKLKDFPIADMVPSMILVMPVSFLWSTYIVPFIG